MKNIFYRIWELVEIILIAVIAVAAIKYFLVQPFIVDGSSMEPNFHDGDYLLVDKLSQRFYEPARGEVIVFKSPQNTSTYFIKRIIGLPGEKVVVNNNKITIYGNGNNDGTVLYEEYIPDDIGNGWVGDVTVKLDEGNYFVLGDNRSNSFDSRYWGEFPSKNIIGVVKLRLWPLSDISFFKDPNYALTSGK